MIAGPADVRTYAIDVHGNRIELEDATSADMDFDPDPDEVEYSTGRRAERLQLVASVVRSFGGAR